MPAAAPIGERRRSSSEPPRPARRARGAHTKRGRRRRRSGGGPVPRDEHPSAPADRRGRAVEGPRFRAARPASACSVSCAARSAPGARRRGLREVALGGFSDAHGCEAYARRRAAFSPRPRAPLRARIAELAALPQTARTRGGRGVTACDEAAACRARRARACRRRSPPGHPRGTRGSEPSPRSTKSRHGALARRPLRGPAVERRRHLESRTPRAMLLAEPAPSASRTNRGARRAQCAGLGRRTVEARGPVDVSLLDEVSAPAPPRAKISRSARASRSTRPPAIFVSAAESSAPDPAGRRDACAVRLGAGVRAGLVAEAHVFTWFRARLRADAGGDRRAGRRRKFPACRRRRAAAESRRMLGLDLLPPASPRSACAGFRRAVLGPAVGDEHHVLRPVSAPTTAVQRVLRGAEREGRSGSSRQEAQSRRDRRAAAMAAPWFSRRNGHREWWPPGHGPPSAGKSPLPASTSVTHTRCRRDRWGRGTSPERRMVASVGVAVTSAHRSSTASTAHLV